MRLYGYFKSALYLEKKFFRTARTFQLGWKYFYETLFCGKTLCSNDSNYDKISIVSKFIIDRKIITYKNKKINRIFMWQFFVRIR